MVTPVPIPNTEVKHSMFLVLVPEMESSQEVVSLIFNHNNSYKRTDCIIIMHHMYTQVHEGNDIQIEGYYYSGRLAPLIENHDVLVRLNSMFSSLETDIRFGPAINEKGDPWTIGQEGKFLFGLYLPENRLHEDKRKDRVSLRDALDELESTLFP